MNQTNHNITTKLDVGCEFEEIQLAVKQISDVLIVYTESTDNDMRGLRENPALWGETFVERHNRLINVLYVLEEHVESIIDRLDSDIKPRTASRLKMSNSRCKTMQADAKRYKRIQTDTGAIQTDTNGIRNYTPIPSPNPI